MPKVTIAFYKKQSVPPATPISANPCFVSPSARAGFVSCSISELKYVSMFKYLNQDTLSLACCLLQHIVAVKVQQPAAGSVRL